MCLAIPVEIVELLDEQRVIVNLGGIHKEASITMVPEAQKGDYVILHAGYALSVLKEEEAQKTLALFDAMLREDAL